MSSDETEEVKVGDEATEEDTTNVMTTQVTNRISQYSMVSPELKIDSVESSPTNKSQSQSQLAISSLLDDGGDTLSTGSDTDLNGMQYSVSENASLSRHLIDDSPFGPRSATESTLGCEMCANYEIKLQQIQETERNLKQQLTAAQHLADRYHTELSGERLYRSELESKMTQLSGQTQEEVNKVSEYVEGLEKVVKSAQDEYMDRLENVKQEFIQLRTNREQVEEKFKKVENDYDKLLGMNRTHAIAMQTEAIDFPNSVEELQVLCLQLREELIETKAAKEHIDDTLRGDVAFLKEQVASEQNEKQQLEENLTEEVNGLRTELGISHSKVSDLEAAGKRGEELERRIAEYQTTIDDLETKLGSLQKERGELEFSNTEFRRRFKTMQQELDTSEAVQRDFVKLSQSLQIELEKIRQAEQEVRWQYDEDVYVCNGCKEAFTKSKLKLHCRHCGKIFCDNCLPKTVPSGSQKRQARVCDVCHTLLVRNTAPYFAESVPNSN